ncbi:hypothetical protein PIB30_028694 [Stylosanthes scabra]|uniref:Gamma-glutamylcyclotransferase family protein n=1 Tax=Stylosanthes scabra TaxID=79078 RepID=A0ABU6UAG1_9FABA|nr:hypothetical protein [Stylosanthes scabra]
MVAENLHHHNDGNNRTVIFSYGTLKRGFSNHHLLQDLMRTGDASFIGLYKTSQRYPLVCGPYKVPFLLNLPGSGHNVHGELYSVSARGLARMDELEGTTRHHYERLPIKLVPAEEEAENIINNDDQVMNLEDESTMMKTEDAPGVLTCAEAYFAHRNYAVEMWKKNGKRGLRCYTKKETKGYVKRGDRPQHLTFLDHIRLFLSDSQ